VLYDVESIVAALELPVLRAGEKEIRCVCPAHEERTGKVDSVGDWSINRDTGEHWCFSCQFGGSSVVGLVAYVHGTDIVTANRWVRENGLSDLEAILYEDAGWDRRRAKRRQTKVDAIETLTDAHLALFEPVPDRMLSVRSLKREAAELYECRWSREHHAWVLPMRRPDYQLLGYQLRAKGWEENYPEGVMKSMTLFGIDKFQTERTAYLVESPLDAVRLNSVGYDGALASFGAAVSTDQMQLIVDYYDTLVVCMDNDGAGWTSVHKIWNGYRQRLNLRFFNYRDIGAKDVGDMDDEEIHRGIDKALPLPVRAL
jgi:hypothetical protein